MSDLEPLPPAVEEMLRVERSLEPADPELQARVLERVRRVVIPPDGGGGDGSSGPPDGAAGASAPAARVSLGLLRGWTLAGVVGFTLGAAAGSAVTTRLLAPRHLADAAPHVSAAANSAAAAPVASSGVSGASPASTEDAPTSAGVSSAFAAPSSVAVGPSSSAEHLPSASAPITMGSHPTPNPSPDRPEASSGTTLARERELLDIARAALRRGHTDVALDAIRRHRAEFPRGQLQEEREALAVQALAVAGKADEARAEAERFRKKFPGSMLGPVVDGVTKEKNAGRP